jgi:uncharacterized protein
MRHDTAGLRVLTPAECMHLLASVTIGRVALSHRALPMILSVQYALVEHGIVIHTTSGTTLDLATDDTVVAFEAEGPAGALEPAWSVVVHGRATTHDRPECRLPASGSVRVVISADEVTGREVVGGDLRPYRG